MNVAGKKVSIVGAAKSGLAAANYLIKNGASVFISDIQKEDKLKAALITEGIIDLVDFEAGVHSEKILASDYIILSPGVRSDLPILLKAAQEGVPVLSEIEAAYRLSKGKRIAVTGSNGKTTTTTLLSTICESHFKEVFLGGNIGIPIMKFASQTTENSVQVLEISSFQLENISLFKPDIAIITNFFENHLDRYPTYQSYIDAKKRIAMNMKQDDYLILNAEQEIMRNMAKEVKCKTAWFGKNTNNLRPAITVKNDCFVYLPEKGEEKTLFPLSQAKIPGEHNIENIMCAALAAILMQIPESKIEEAVKNFSGVEHRLEFVKNINGADYINDSKGTNCAASIIAMRACKKPLILIAGGRDKGTDLSDWVKSIRLNCKTAILYGEAKQRFRSALEGLVPLKIALSFEEAVKMAHESAQPGDTVLLSPACSSYDLFLNFEIRGTRFKELVHELDDKPI